MDALFLRLPQPFQDYGWEYDQQEYSEKRAFMRVRWGGEG